MPQDFDPKIPTLMVEMTSDPMTTEETKMAEYVKQNYPYKCSFVYHSDIYAKTGTFGDTKIYRYALIGKSFIHRSIDHTKRDLVRKDFYFYDRLHDKSFPIIINTIVEQYNNSDKRMNFFI